MAKKQTTEQAQFLAGEELLASIQPGRAIDPAKFQRLVDYYNIRPPGPDQSLSGATLYFYRKFPKTDFKKTPGKKNSNIHKIEGVSEDSSVNLFPSDIKQFITDRFGGGRYNVMLTDTKRDGDSELATATFKIDELKFSPILDHRELVTNDPETAAWITRQVQVGELARDDQGNVCLPGEAQAAGPQNSDAAWARVARDAIAQNRGETVEAHAIKKTVDMVADTATDMIKRLAPKDPIEQFTAMAAAFKQDSGGLLPMVQLMITQAQENTKITLAMMQMIATRNAPPAPTTEDATGGVGVVERIMDLVAKTAGKESWIDQIKGLLPMLLPIFMARMSGGPAAAPVPADVLRMMNGAANGGAPPPQPAPIGMDQRRIEDLAGHAWQALARGQDGSDYANAIDTFFGPETYDAIYNLGKPALTAALLNTQAGQHFQANMPAFIKFVDDFMDYGDKAAQEAAAAAGAPPSAPPPAPPPGGPTPSTAPMGAV